MFSPNATPTTALAASTSSLGSLGPTSTIVLTASTSSLSSLQDETSATEKMTGVPEIDIKKHLHNIRAQLLKTLEEAETSLQQNTHVGFSRFLKQNIDNQRKSVKDTFVTPFYQRVYDNIKEYRSLTKDLTEAAEGRKKSIVALEAQLTKDKERIEQADDPLFDLFNELYSSIEDSFLSGVLPSWHPGKLRKIMHDTMESIAEKKLPLVIATAKSKLILFLTIFKNKILEHYDAEVRKSLAVRAVAYFSNEPASKFEGLSTFATDRNKANEKLTSYLNELFNMNNFDDIRNSVVCSMDVSHIISHANKCGEFVAAKYADCVSRKMDAESKSNSAQCALVFQKIMELYICTDDPASVDADSKLIEAKLISPPKPKDAKSEDDKNTSGKGVKNKAEGEDPNPSAAKKPKLSPKAS